MNYGSPFTKDHKPKKEDTELEKFKKLKPRISKGTVKALTKHTASEAMCFWVERWLEHLVRENSYPPQIISDNAMTILGQILDPKSALLVLERLRNEFNEAHHLELVKDDMSFLEGIEEGIPLTPIETV